MADRKTFLLRIDPALWAELETWAQAELRSVNGQIEYILRQAVQRRKGAPGGVPQEPEEEPPSSGEGRGRPTFSIPRGRSQTTLKK